jgi:signal transduction histidine kinase
MGKVPFTVSARAARLIGRENVATSQGAVTELVKNAYDADASVCAVLFLPRWKQPPASLEARELEALEAISPGIGELFVARDGVWCAKADINASQAATISDAQRQVLDMWLVDNGHGMSLDVIQNRWMVIGTDTKELFDRSAGGRVVTGAKGIGRFALDRLGRECELFSSESSAESLAHWLVDWSDFEGSGKLITDVEAVLESENASIQSVYLANGLTDVLPNSTPLRNGESKPVSYDAGTAIRIGLLNDIWDQRDTSRLGETLEALLPPHDRADFDIFIFDSRAPSEAGFIENAPPDQFDYRMDAMVHADGRVGIKITRQEIDVSKIQDEVFQLEALTKPGFSRADFERGTVEYETNLEKLVDKKGGELASYNLVGPFNFVFYFFKLNNPTADNLKKYPQKNFNVGSRKRWLKTSGGIRLYRDNFRVRPYGEPRTPSYDWLLLGERASRNPTQASKIGWRVPPQQVAGTINITKNENSLLADQSNREGIMNERVFQAFRDIVVAIIREFEVDRSYILQQFLIAYEKANPEPKEAEDGRRIAKRVLREASRRSGSTSAAKNAGSDANDQGDDATIDEGARDLQKVSIAYDSEVKKNELLRDHIQVMRGMATLGTVLVSFTHELRQIKANVDYRSQRLEKAVRKVVDEKKLAELSEAQNPFRIIERLGNQDEKVHRWVNFALSAVSPAKRRKRRMHPLDYMNGLRKYWEDFLATKSTVLKIDVHKGVDQTLLAHEIDLDSIFYNLINNSVEALVKPSSSKEREISIAVTSDQPGWLTFSYSDNGPGLPEEIGVRDNIFLYGISSKKEESSGDAVGTGLGMWLLKNVVDDYNGRVEVTSQVGTPGFSIVISLPARTADGSGASNE